MQRILTVQRDARADAARTDRFRAALGRADYDGMSAALQQGDQRWTLEQLRSLPDDNLRRLDDTMRAAGDFNTTAHRMVTAVLTEKTMTAGRHQQTARPGAAYGVIEGHAAEVHDGRIVPGGANRPASYKFEVTFMPDPAVVHATLIEFVQVARVVDLRRPRPPTRSACRCRRTPARTGKETLPLGGLSNVLTVFCNESGEYITYTSDEHGFNNPAGLWQNRQVEVVAVGDSFTHGACVPRDENFVGVIRARRPLTLSLGMDSNGPTMMLASLKEYAQRLKPKIVLWFYFGGNDLRDMDYERLSTLLMRYLTGGWTQNLFDRQGEIDSALEAYIEQARKKKSLRIGFEDTITIRHLREAFALWYGQGDAGTTVSATTAYFSAEVTEAEIDRFRSVLKEALSTVRGWGGQMYFVYLPEWARYAEPQSANKNRDRVLSVVHTPQLPLIDLHPVFTQVPDPVGLFPFHRNNHYNSEGHRLVGEEVLRVLSETDGGSR